MIPDTETLSNIAQLHAARDAELADANAARIEAWARRYPHDLVACPACIEPPKWPAQRSSIPRPCSITPINAKARIG